MAVDAQLPEKEKISPNQHSWPESVAQMGEKYRAMLSQGKVNSALTAQHISKPNYKCLTDDNPYRVREQSGKHAKPDVYSANANT